MLPEAPRAAETQSNNASIDQLFSREKPYLECNSRYSFLQEVPGHPGAISREAFVDLCAIAQAEAEEGNPEAVVAVAYTILNRAHIGCGGGDYPNRITSVIMRDNHGRPEYQPVGQHGRQWG